MELSDIYAVTILVDDEHEFTYHVHSASGDAPTYADLSAKILPLMRARIHPASDFEVLEAVDVQSSLDIFKAL